MSDEVTVNRLALACSIVNGYVQNNAIKSDEISNLLSQVYKTIVDLSEGVADKGLVTKSAVPIDKSVTPDFIICLEDGVKLKMLKRYLRTQFDMTPDEYRRKWALPHDYPMVAPNYAKTRSKLAKKIGLGTAQISHKKKTTKKKA